MQVNTNHGTITEGDFFSCHRIKYSCYRMNENDEILEIVDSEGNVIGRAARSELHGNPALIHPVVHVLVFDRGGRLLLQKRSLKKDVAPGKWDTSVGGHLNPGEDIRQAALREAKEELGITGLQLHYLYRHLFSNRIESELVSTFSCIYEGEIRFNRTEIDEVRYWTMQEIRDSLETGAFSRHFESEIRNYLKITRQDGLPQLIQTPRRVPGLNRS
jgi:isopentenyldiphosphate isomerase